MAIETQLYYIGTSKIKEIRSGGSITFDWGTWGSWTKLTTPSKKSTTTVKYNKSTKDAAGSTVYGGEGGVTFCGTSIPATATRTIDGVERTVNVRYYKRGYTVYTRTSALKKKKKMSRTIYTAYQYILQYQDKAVVNKEYSTYEDGTEYIYFADHYYDNDGQAQTTSGHLLHPVDCSVTYTDIRRNFNSETNNSDNRDNAGSFVLSNVRANVVSLGLKWQGLTAQQGADLLDTLNPSKDTNGQYNYLTVQYNDPATGKPKNGTFYASERTVTKYANGTIKELTVTLIEV